MQTNLRFNSVLEKYLNWIIYCTTVSNYFLHGPMEKLYTRSKFYFLSSSDDRTRSVKNVMKCTISNGKIVQTVPLANAD